MKYDNLHKTIIQFLQGDMPLTSHPYAGLAEQLGISEEEVLDKIRLMLDDGTIRRMGAILRHQRAGFTVNAMVAWNTKLDEADQAGQALAAFPAVSHCYLRDVPKDFYYNLFTMIHAHTEAELNKIIGQMSSASGLKDFQIINSIKELKKVSMSYF